jgi:drug/metabolite transporter (DMT)-like permease
LAAVHRPPAADFGLLAVALAAVSTSGPLVAAAAVPGLAVAFWRTGMASGLLLPWSVLRHRRELAGLTRRERWLAAAAGLLLGAHFATWIPSIKLTTVATATALVATQPVWAALIARVRGHQVSRGVWLGIGVAVAGAALITGVDVTISWTALLGDGLALVGGFFAASYVTVGGEVRRTVSTSVYTTVCYATAAAGLVVVCAIAARPLAGYAASDWAKLAALTVGPQLLGHSVINRVLRTTSPTVVSLAILFEVPGASIIALLWLGQVPPTLAVPGIVLLLVGITLVVGIRPQRAAPSAGGAGEAAGLPPG